MTKEFIDQLIEKAKGKKIIKFSPSFRQSAKDNLGLSEDEIRQIELDVIKQQAQLREGIQEAEK